jgi:hypothetical protein
MDTCLRSLAAVVAGLSGAILRRYREQARFQLKELVETIEDVLKYSLALVKL